MRHCAHDELHELIDSNLLLKTKSDEAHALPATSLEEGRAGKFLMMAIYAKALGCTRLEEALEFTRRVYELRGEKPSEEFTAALNLLKEEYDSARRCHSPEGNDYSCYCE